MNKRIRELAEQAGKYARDYVTECKHYGHYMEHNEYELRFAEKFAELIVKECLDQCYFNGMNDELYAGQLKAAAYIEKHFGVENERSTT